MIARATAICVFLGLLALGGCGTQEQGSMTSAATQVTATRSAAAHRSHRQPASPARSHLPPAAQTDRSPAKHPGPPTGAASFKTKGADNSIPESGSEASAAELGAAAAALHGYLDARATGAWAKACSYLAPALAAQLSQLTGAPRKLPCARLLAGLAAGIPAASAREAAIAVPGALRVDGERALLLFHGAHDTDYFIPMAREGGRWKVAAIAPSALG